MPLGQSPETESWLSGTAYNAILEAVEQTNLTIGQVRLSFNELLLAFSVAASHSSDSTVSPCNWKKSEHIGQTDYFHITILFCF